MIVSIAESEYSAVEGAEPESVEQVGDIWTGSVAVDAIDYAVLDSLERDMLVQVWDRNSRESVVNLTELGFQVYQQIKQEK